jgi:hypothetical protein
MDVKGKSGLEIKIEGVSLSKEKYPDKPIIDRTTSSNKNARLITLKQRFFVGRFNSAMIGNIPLC